MATIKSIEEKAKRYDVAIKVAQRFYNNSVAITNKGLEDIFPELKESEDKRMIQYFKDLAPFDKADELYEKYGFSHKDAIAWLEKQAEHANFRNKIQIGDKVTRNEDGVLVNLSQLNRVAKKGEKQGEQNPTDNAEPKFHKGDWVVYCNDDVDLITGIEENGYRINNGGYIPFVCENEMRLWDITDAKVGDVLVSESTCGLGTWYCIFKSLDGDESMTVYCYLARDGRFETKKELCFDKDPYNTKPATKEQRDQLEKAMANAGYTFDFDKKELKKIEGTTAWSEEDEVGLGDAMWAIEQARTIAKDENDMGNLWYAEHWLKSLKDRVQPQPKQEWSEEDEQTFIKSVEALEDFGKFELADWLKEHKNQFLKPQNTWKPSKEQMNTLEYYMHTLVCNEYKEILFGLYADLKKLMEE